MKLLIISNRNNSIVTSRLSKTKNVHLIFVKSNDFCIENGLEELISLLFKKI